MGKSEFTYVVVCFSLYVSTGKLISLKASMTMNTTRLLGIPDQVGCNHNGICLALTAVITDCTLTPTSQFTGTIAVCITLWVEVVAPLTMDLRSQEQTGRQT